MTDGAARGGEDARTRFSGAIDYVRFPLAVLVVAIHWNSLLENWKFLPPYKECMEGAIPAVRLVWRAVLDGVVPAFFFISGYLFFRKKDGGTGFTLAEYGRKLTRRIHTLLIPYLIWNIIAYFTVTTYTPAPILGDSSLYVDNLWNVLTERNWHIFWDNSGIGGCHYPILTPLWYIRDLMVMALVSPVFYILLRPVGRRWLSMLRNLSLFGGMVYLLINGLWPWATGLSAGAVLWFGVGAAFSLQKGEALVLRHAWAGALIYAACVAWLDYTYIHPVDTWLRPLSYVAQIGRVLGVFMCADWLLRHTTWRLPRDFAAATMFIYCWHNVYIIGPEFILSALMALNGGFAWCSIDSPAAPLYLVLPPVLEAAMGVYVYKLLRRFLPRTTGVLVGR